MGEKIIRVRFRTYWRNSIFSNLKKVNHCEWFTNYYEEKTDGDLKWRNANKEFNH